MELKTDLLKIEKKSVPRIIIGISGISIVIAWLIAKSVGDSFFKLEFLDWLFPAAILLNGITHTVEGFGFSISRLFGKSFIDINEQSITLKLRLFEKAQHLKWDDIKALEYMANKYRVTMNDGNQGILNLSKMKYLLKKEVKAIIAETADSKGILIR